MTNRLTHEENILYLMIELHHVLARNAPRWAPEQKDAAAMAGKPIREVTGDHPAVVTGQQ